jgi:hypothetical protein
MVLNHQPPPGSTEAEREAAEAPAVVELRANDAGGYPATRALVKIRALREAGMRVEHVAFSFMKRRVQPLMARDTLGYQYIGDNCDNSPRKIPYYRLRLIHFGH